MGKTPKLPPCGAVVVVNVRFYVVDNPPFTLTDAESVYFVSGLITPAYM